MPCSVQEELSQPANLVNLLLAQAQAQAQWNSRRMGVDRSQSQSQVDHQFLCNLKMSRVKMFQRGKKNRVKVIPL